MYGFIVNEAETFSGILIVLGRMVLVLVGRKEEECAGHVEF